jgi:beta-glucosidase-like glycosyl hydrolase
MGLCEKDARLIVGGVFAARLPHDLDDIDPGRFPVSSFIVFRDVLKPSFEDTRLHLLDIKKKLGRRGVDPIFMMDEEGGRVSQISGFFPGAPSAVAVSKWLRPAEARELYGHAAETLAGLGIDINLAPCMDVNTEPLNPVIGCRAFGDDRVTVETYGKAFIEAFRGHTGCVAKHFPGHGMTTVDSHLAMPVVNTTVKDLETIHIPPFVSAARVGVEGIMISHCRYEALDTGTLPASLSRTIGLDLLRHRLGFKGLVITDSLDMDAVTRNRDPGEAARSAVSAGADILLYTENTARFEQAFEALTADLVSGRLHRSRLMESISRRNYARRRIPSRLRPTEGISRKRYLELRDRVISASVRTEDPRRVLPIGTADFVYVTTDPALFDRAPLQKGVHREIARPEEASDKVLLLWLVEPLRHKQSLETMRRMVDASQVAVLVTSYRPLADILGDCAAKVVTDDTSPDTLAGILSRLFARR